MYGAQAACDYSFQSGQFENDVEMYGAQADISPDVGCQMFENDVEMYGAQATTPSAKRH